MPFTFTSSCNICGWTSLLPHNIYWAGDWEACTRCSTTWPCEHGGGANIYMIKDADAHLVACNLCQKELDYGHILM